MISICVNQRRPFVCLQFFSMSEKFWQYWMLSLVDKQRLKLSIYSWQGFWYCCCWYCCCCTCWGCCWASWPWEEPPIMPLTAWWATSEPAPKAIPVMMVLPMPENMPPRLWVCCCCCTGACMGRVAVGAWRGGGAGDRDLPPLLLLLEPPPLGIISITN